MHIHTSKRKFGYDMCNAPDILINLRFIVSNLCTKSIIDANYGILSRLSRSDRFFKVNFARVIRFKVFKTLKFGTPKLLRNYSIATFFQFLIFFDAAKCQGKESFLDFFFYYFGGKRTKIQTQFSCKYSIKFSFY